jgi:hypothetical protein
MRKALSLFTLLALFSASPAPASILYAAVPPGCTRIEYGGEVFTYTALVDGSYTFKGGSVGNSENAYLITVELLAGEVWNVPSGGAAISHVDVCPYTVTTTTSTTTSTTSTTTTTDTTSTTLPPCEVPILSDPASLRWPGGGFSIHGRLSGPGPVDGILVTLETEEDEVFLSVGCTLAPVPGKQRWACQDDDATALVKEKKDGTFTFRLKGTPDFTDPSTKTITTRVYAAECTGTNTAEWLGRIGDSIKNRF